MIAWWWLIPTAVFFFLGGIAFFFWLDDWRYNGWWYRLFLRVR
jgi:hypothetical protein